MWPPQCRPRRPRVLSALERRLWLWFRRTVSTGTSRRFFCKAPRPCGHQIGERRNGRPRDRGLVNLLTMFTTESIMKTHDRERQSRTDATTQTTFPPLLQNALGENNV